MELQIKITMSYYLIPANICLLWSLTEDAGSVELEKRIPRAPLLPPNISFWDFLIQGLTFPQVKLKTKSRSSCPWESNKHGNQLLDYNPTFLLLFTNHFPFKKKKRILGSHSGVALTVARIVHFTLFGLQFSSLHFASGNEYFRWHTHFLSSMTLWVNIHLSSSS